jgi:hypothetical protein
VAGCSAGVGATLARDVPCSAAYWGMLEPIRRGLLPSDGSAATPSRTIAVNMLAGGIGGAAASAMTQPLVSHTYPLPLNLCSLGHLL